MNPRELGWDEAKSGNFSRMIKGWRVTIGYSIQQDIYWTQLRCANVNKYLDTCFTLEEAIAQVDRILGKEESVHESSKL